MKTIQYRSLPFFVAVVCLVALTGIQFEPGSWYATLRKPPLTPPNWVFPVAWTLLYLMIALAGWLAWQYQAGRPRHQAFICYGMQLFLNASWSWVFFGQHWMVVGFFNILLLLLAIAANITLFLRLSRLAALLLVPYLIWVGFALYLNIGIAWLN